MNDGASFLRVGGACAIGAAIATLGYAASLALVGFELAPDPGRLLSPAALLVAAVLTMVAFAGLYRHVLNGDAGFALLALLLGVLGAVGAALRGGYELALAVNPPPADELARLAVLPTPTDPRGMLSLGVLGLAIVVAGVVIRRRGLLPGGLAPLGYAAGAAMVATYVTRLVVVTPTEPPVLVPATAAAVLVPVWLAWLGIGLLRAVLPERH